MPTVDVVVESEIELTPRVLQLSGMFDVPPTEKIKETWRADLPIEDRDWQIGLVTGPSGCGKTQVSNQIWGKEKIEFAYQWKAPSIIGDFDKKFGVAEISRICSAVGFNTIPSWMKPYRVLSNGEKFRAECARRILESDGLVVMDEFTSVVDRQVAKITSHAIQKEIRKNGEQFVAISCHSDIIDWLQPDWVYKPATNNFEWRCLRRRPNIELKIERVHYSEWKRFSRYHYMSADLNKSARCIVARIGNETVGFAGMLTRPISRGKNAGQYMIGISRLVVLPDYQGVGIGKKLINIVGSFYSDMGVKTRFYPAHPALIRGVDRDPNWACVKKPGTYKPLSQYSETSKYKNRESVFGGRPNATFEYIGPPYGDPNFSSKIMGKLII